MAYGEVCSLVRVGADVEQAPAAAVAAARHRLVHRAYVVMACIGMAAVLFIVRI